MDASTLASLIIALTIGIAIFGCLRIIGFEYYNAVLWHNLKIQVHDLRIDQQGKLQQMLESDGAVIKVDEAAENPGASEAPAEAA